MKTLVVSDRLKLESPPRDVDLIAWRQRPSVEGYPLVILDLYFGDPTGVGYVEINDDRHRFYEMGREVAKCLEADGVVIACLGPIACTTRELGTAAHGPETYNLKRARSADEQIPEPRFESSYDWMDQGLLRNIQIGHQHTKSSEGINWKLPKDRFSQIRESFSVYSETFANVAVYGDGTATITYSLQEPRRWSSIQNVIQTHPLILSTAKHTELPVAMSFNYNFFDGRLVLMPAFAPPKDALVARALATELKELGELVYSLSHNQRDERPDWVDDYIAPQAVAIQQNISDLEQKIASLAEQKESYYTVLPLLYGTDTELEDAVEHVLSAADGSINVLKSEPGAHIDFFVEDSFGHSLAVEVTGVKGLLRHNDNHWADFLNYMPDHNSKNELDRVERIVLVVNTYRDIPFADRDRNNDMATPVKKTATDNGICVVRSGDLYKMWLKIVDGSMTKQDVFNTLFSTDGIYEPPGGIC